MTDLYYIELTPDSGSIFTVVLGENTVFFIPRYNYTVKCWTLDIIDSQDEIILSGLMLFPSIDILATYPQVKQTLGSLVLVELNLNDYKDPDLFGINTKILWYPPGEEIVLPE
jgi:hypothetical protein